MSTEKPIPRASVAEILIEALPYIRRFAGITLLKTFFWHYKLHFLDSWMLFLMPPGSSERSHRPRWLWHA